MSVIIKLSLFLQFLPPGLLFVTSLRVSLEDQLIKIAEFIDTKQGRVSSGAREIPPRSSTSAARSKNATLNSTREPGTAFPLRSSPWGSVEADTWRNPVSCTSFFEAAWLRQEVDSRSGGRVIAAANPPQYFYHARKKLKKREGGRKKEN